MTSHEPLAGFTTDPDATSATNLIAALRDGLTPIDITKDDTGSYTVHYDHRVFDRDTVNIILAAVGIPPARPIEEIHAEAAAKILAIADAELAAHPGRRTADIALRGGRTVTAACRQWCTVDHRADGPGIHPEDIYHASTEAAVEVTRPSSAPETLLSGWITVYPYSSTDSEPRAAIWFSSGDCEDYDAPGLGRLAADLRAAAAWVDGLRAQLTAAVEEAGQ
ncbi:hypothetical protein [Kitasatospora sp. NPDC005751]|uniref:DUF6907 domain-containing protein n=1 Tax=Kitasatospora sp. NPDC005751 TaxID=3157064 RepID=UPI003411EE3A